jgi:hypothetical protein
MRIGSHINQKVFSSVGRRSAVRLERVCTFLREIHPAKTADNTAADTGISSPTVRKWLEGKASPSGAGVVRLVAVYGPEFLCAVMDAPPAWLTEAGRDASRARLEEKIAALRTQLEGHAQ